MYVKGRETSYSTKTLISNFYQCNPKQMGFIEHLTLRCSLRGLKTHIKPYWILKTVINNAF